MEQKLASRRAEIAARSEVPQLEEEQVQAPKETKETEEQVQKAHAPSTWELDLSDGHDEEMLARFAAMPVPEGRNQRKARKKEEERLAKEIKEKEEIDSSVTNAAASLLSAAHRGNVDTVADILKRFRTTEYLPAVINRASTAGTTALLAACENGHAEVVRLLLTEPQLCVDWVRVKDCTTPLFWASFKGHVKIVEMLLERGANAQF